MRLAVGAARSRLVIQMLTESITLSTIGAAVGLPLAWLGIRALLRFLPNDALAPLALDLSPDRRMAGFALIVTVLSGIAFGLAPALRASRQDLFTVLKRDTGSARAGSWDFGRMLVCFQIALSLALLAGAGLFARALANLRAADLGLKRDNVLFIDTNMVQSGYSPQQTRRYFETLQQDIQQLPDVMAASIAVNNPFGYTGWKERILVEGRDSELYTVDSNAVSPRFFEAMGIPILRGRDFRNSDETAPLQDRAAIVNELFAQRFFGGESAIGRRFCLGNKWAAAQTYQIVGVVANARYQSFESPVAPMIYRPFYRDMQWSGGVLCIRTGGNPKRLIATIRRRTQDIDPVVMVTEAHTLQDNIDVALLEQRSVATLGGFFAIVALLLAAVGIYGVMSQAVTRRTREIGIRMALGAGRVHVLWMMLGNSLVTVLIGITLGLTAAVTLARYAEPLLFGVKPRDPYTIAGAVLLLLLTAVLAGFLPAHRATRVQPVAALKHE